MKTLPNMKPSFMHVILVSASIMCATACNSNHHEDTKDVAEEHNEAKFNNTDSERDAQFLVNAAEVNLEEIQLGQLAQQRSTMPDIQSLGKMMYEGHTKSLAELTNLAKKKLVTIPAAPTDKAQDAYKKLNDKSGNYFDKEYTDMMVKGHKEAIEKFENYIKDSKDADIKEWATATLKDLRLHLDHSLTCEKKCENM